MPGAFHQVYDPIAGSVLVSALTASLPVIVLAVLLAGWRAMLGVLPAVATAGISFAAGQFVVSNFVGPELTDTLASLLSLGSTALLLQVWQPRDRWAGEVIGGAPGHARHGDPGRGSGVGDGAPLAEAGGVDSRGRIVRAYATYAILVVVVLAGQIGNLDRLRDVPPPLNVTALLRCGQAGNRLCPDPWIGPALSTDPQAFPAGRSPPGGRHPTRRTGVRSW